jgi:hypothetical protein
MFGIKPEEIKKRSDSLVKRAQEIGESRGSGPDRAYMAEATRLYNIYDYLMRRRLRNSERP